MDSNKLARHIDFPRFPRNDRFAFKAVLCPSLCVSTLWFWAVRQTERAVWKFPMHTLEARLRLLLG